MGQRDERPPDGGASDMQRHATGFSRQRLASQPDGGEAEVLIGGQTAQVGG